MEHAVKPTFLSSTTMRLLPLPLPLCHTHMRQDTNVMQNSLNIKIGSWNTRPVNISSTDELFYTGKDGRLLLELMVAKEKTFRFLRSMYLTMLQAKTVKVCIYF